MICLHETCKLKKSKTSGSFSGMVSGTEQCRKDVPDFFTVCSAL